ncbi:putative multicopper oxidase, type 1 [Phyllosticta citriasiana]|uniref:putative multicopper oxidase, type 1 n=1 Tax=Phyllosticta citriasiana TaxID=595635 RepID=UPI0030FDE70E
MSFQSVGSARYQQLGQHEPDVEEQTPSLLKQDGQPLADEQRSGGFARKWLVLLELFIMSLVLSIALSAVFLRRLHPHDAVAGHGNQSETTSARSKYLLDPDWDSQAPAQTREYQWTITDANLNPDGVFRPLILINNEFPGPLIECNEGDTLVINVKNQATNATSFHWHGLFMNGSNWMDGTVGVTQCPIAPNANMTYRFKVDGQSGTYWYHAHMGMQTADGLYGPLIVHSPLERSLQKLDYASDQILMIQDYYYDLSSALLPKYLSPGRENVEPVPDGGLINGRNIRDCSTLQDRSCDNSTAELATLDLEKDKAHRIRVIHVGAFAEFHIQLDEHQFAVTEVDGTDVLPTFYHRLNIHPGQRYSIVVSANATDRDAFWLRAKMVTACFKEENPSLVDEVKAVVRYSSRNEKQLLDTPSSKDWTDALDVTCLDMNTTGLQPVAQIPVPDVADSQIYLRANFEIGAWRLSRGFFNNSSFRSKLTTPTLHRMVDGISSQNASFALPDQLPQSGINSVAFDPVTEFVYQTTGIRVIDILVSNFDDGNHPLHLHGHKFFVLASGHGYPPADLHSSLNMFNPLRRDTASVEGFGWILLRVVLDNPGIHAFHCHLSFHQEVGMMMLFAARTDKMADWKVPDDQRSLCKLDGVERGDRPKDEIWFGNFGKSNEAKD